MALWTPAEISPAAWFDADDTATITIDVGVSAWADKSGSGRNVTQATGTAQPTIVAGDLNGKDVLSFDGAGDYLRHTLSSAIATVAISYFSIHKVVGTSSDVRPPALLDYTNTGRPVDRYMSLIYISTGSVASDYNIASATSDYILYELTAIKDGAGSGTHSIIERVNGVQVSSKTRTATWSTLNQQLNIGQRSDGSKKLNGLVALVLLVDGLVDVDTRQKIEGWAMWDWGMEASLPVGHPYESAAPTISTETILIQLLDQTYNIEGLLLALFDQPYHLTVPYLAKLDQLYGLQLLALLAQHYGDVPIRRALLEQYWGSAAMLRRLVDQPYHDARALRQILDQEWSTYGALLAAVEQRYSISAGQLLALAEQQYNLSEYELLRSMLDQIYVLQPSGVVSQKPIITVTSSVSSPVSSKRLHPYHIEVEIDEDEFAIKGEIHLADEAEFLSCIHIETELIIPIDSTEYHLLVEGPWRSRQPGITEYYVPLASKTILLDSPYADGLDEEELGGKMASVIVQELANIKSITVSWNMIDWFIPEGILYSNGETPLAIIRKIVSAAGGIVQSSPDGNLICRAEYPISIPDWETSTPAFYLTDMDNFFSVSSKPDIRDGFNRFSISDQDEGIQGLTLEEVNINETTKHILVYQVPFNAADVIALRTSGGTWVGVINEGVVTENILDEQVEIVGGEGNTTKPIYGVIGLPDYKEIALGTITTSESGAITTAILENSLVDISYITKYRKFIVTDPNIEDVQFWPEVL